MLDYFNKLNRNIVDQIKYRGTMVTGVITADNGDGTYAVKIAQADKAYPYVETAFPNMVFGVDEVVLITFEYGNKEMPRILGYAKRIVQHPVDVDVDYSGEGGDPITTVKTLDAYSVTMITALLEGQISLSKGTGNCIRRGFQYGLTTDYGSDTHTDGSYGEGYYAIQVTDLSSSTIYHFRAYLKDVNGNFVYGEDKTFTTIFYAFTIDIGSEAIDRDDSWFAGDWGYTLIDKNNPANESGKIILIEIWAEVNLSGCKVATFYRPDPENYPRHFSTRDYVTIGDVTTGGKRVFIVNLNVVAGDYIGTYFVTGEIKATPKSVPEPGFAGLWFLTYDRIPCTDRHFSLAHEGHAISLHGTG